MKSFIISMLLFFPASLYAQKIEKYFDYIWKETVPEKSRFYALIEKTDSGWYRRDYFIHERSLQMAGLFEDEICKTENGTFYFFHPNQRLMQVGRYVHGKKDGLWLTYYQNGMMSDSVYYQNGNPLGVRLQLYSNGYPSDSSYWNADGSGVEISWYDNGIPSAAGRYENWQYEVGKWQFFHKNGKLSALESYEHGALVDKQYFDESGNGTDTTNKDREALFPGGPDAWKKYLDKNLYFPTQYEFANADEAVVVVDAVIDEDGNVTEVEVTPLYPAFDQIAVNVIKRSPKWQPAVQHNRKVKYRIRQAVTFAEIEN